MKDSTVKDISNKLNISKSTVSKAIRHCSGVDSETRQSILDEIRIINYQPESDCDIYVILPDIPQYFWKELRKGIKEGSREDIVSIKHNIYTNPKDENAVLSYLDEAETLNARAIIIAAYITPKIHEKLESLRDGRLILMLSEYHEFMNGFFVGADAYTDGYRMGKEYLSRYPDRKLIALSITGNTNIQKRLSGFKQAIKEENEELLNNVAFIDLDRKILKDMKLFPSKLAPLFVDAAGDSQAVCIYSLFGIFQLPLAITKAKLTKKAVCMCHDYFTEKSDSAMTITCNQDVTLQGRMAMELAANYVTQKMYPDEKKTIIPSLINISKH